MSAVDDHAICHAQRMQLYVLAKPVTSYYTLHYYVHSTFGGDFNEPCSLLTRAFYFISCSIHSQFASVILFIICKWHSWYRHF